MVMRLSQWMRDFTSFTGLRVQIDPAFHRRMSLAMM
jgi:hypothetical protein